MRAPFQVLVFPYFPSRNPILYAVFSRSDSVRDFWQAISGGGEDEETPMEAAIREAWEEGEISDTSNFMQLDATASIPATNFEASESWGDEIYVVPEYSFGVEIINMSLTISYEHLEYRWLDFEAATSLLKHDGNRIALWELNQRLKRSGEIETSG
jgi:dATP pyrophosphohydrolase